MRVGSLFSGIGGIDLGLERAGMRVVFQCEADPWRRAVLRSHWPDVPCYEDVRDVGTESERTVGGSDAGARFLSELARSGWRIQSQLPIDLLCGGFPCQDLSVAGRRAGLAGARSSLFFEFARVADALRPAWLLIENVPGLLSSNHGRDFAVVLATLAELGYGVAWRVLDSRYFGVPQRRRRVFVVGRLGADGAAPFLPFLEGGQGDSAAGGEAGAGVAPALSGRSPSRLDDQGSGQLVSIAAPLSHGSNPNSNAAGRRRDADENLVTAFAWQQGDDSAFTGENRGRSWVTRAGDYTGALGKSRYDAVAGPAHGVRRLTPTECCRLQGFPDDWLGLPNEPPDSPRYAALGDAVTVNVAEWIGRRILAAESLASPARQEGETR